MHQLVEELKTMSDERFLVVYEKLSQHGYGPMDRQVAEALKFRPQAIRKLPMAQRAKRGRSILLKSANAELAYELLGSYLMKEHQGIITGFLDKTGVEHEDGMISDLEAGKPDPAKIDAAIAELDDEFDAEDVTIYVAMAAGQWPDVEGLDAAYRARKAKVAS